MEFVVIIAYIFMVNIAINVKIWWLNIVDVFVHPNVIGYITKLIETHHEVVLIIQTIGIM